MKDPKVKITLKQLTIPDCAEGCCTKERIVIQIKGKNIYIEDKSLFDIEEIDLVSEILSKVLSELDIDTDIVKVGAKGIMK